MSNPAGIQAYIDAKVANDELPFLITGHIALVNAAEAYVTTSTRRTQFHLWITAA